MSDPTSIQMEAAKAADELRARIQGVVTWLRGVIAGDADLTPPPDKDLSLIAAVIEAAAPGYVQRDAAFEIPDEVEVTLKRPLRRVGKPDEAELTVLRFRPPTAGETRKIAVVEEKRGGTSAGFAMLALLSQDGLLEQDIERLLAIDMQRCGEALEPFLALRPLSGGGLR